MNRYLLRSLVAIVTFSIGVAVGSITRPSKYQNRYSEPRCRKAVRMDRTQSYLVPLSSPTISIDSRSTDPVKLLYSQTRMNPTGNKRQTVDFIAENNSKREIASYTVSYQSIWASKRHGGGGSVSMTRAAGSNSSQFRNIENVSIECDADETLSLWVSSVEFKDGSRWTNPRYPNQSTASF